jgi:hypothetical protein
MATRILAVSTVLLAAFFLHQYSQTSQLRAEMAGAQTRAAADARASVLASLGTIGSELQPSMQWLDSFYRSDAGLQRPQGLWIHGHPDYEAIKAWIFDVYVQHRLAGETPEQARQAVVSAIEQTEEWRAKHQK